MLGVSGMAPYVNIPDLALVIFLHRTETLDRYEISIFQRVGLMPFLTLYESHLLSHSTDNTVQKFQQLCIVQLDRCLTRLPSEEHGHHIVQGHLFIHHPHYISGFDMNSDLPWT